MKVKFLFVNTQPAQCSIHESGKQIFAALDNSPYWDIIYTEISDLDRSALLEKRIAFHDGTDLGEFDAYIFNYHDITMRNAHRINGQLQAGLDPSILTALPAPVFGIILEVEPNNPWPRLHEDVFNGYFVIDPTLEYPDPRFIACPRPLPLPVQYHYTEPDRPVIGSFGFPTRDKSFDKIVEAVNAEFDSAVVRINIPHATFADDKDTEFNAIANACYSKAKPGIEVIITREFFTDQELIRWCAENTLNIFLYSRDMPGLAAVTDQAISAGRPLAVSDNRTFRHIHKYITPYPQRSLRESIAVSQSEVQQMQQDWSHAAFQEKIHAALFGGDDNE